MSCLGCSRATEAAAHKTRPPRPKLDGPFATVRTIDACREIDTCHTFPISEEMLLAIAPCFMETVSVQLGREPGPRCPAMRLAR